MGKRLLTALLGLSVLLSLSACGGETVPRNERVSPSASSPATSSTGTSTPTQTEPAEEKVWTQEVHSGIREDGTFNEGTLFIGDSLTYGLVNEYLRPYELLGDAKYMAVVGAPLSRFFSSQQLSGDACLCSPEFANLTYSEAAAKMGEQATAIYLMLGTNYQLTATADKYIEVVDYLLENCPNATVYLQLVPYSSKSIVDYETINGYIQEAYRHYQDQGIEKVVLIDTYSSIGIAVVSDGVHLNSEGRDAWYMAILANAINNNIPE